MTAPPTLGGVNLVIGHIQPKFEVDPRVIRNFEVEMEHLRSRHVQNHIEQVIRDRERITQQIEQARPRIEHAVREARKLSAGLFPAWFSKAPTTTERPKPKSTSVRARVVILSLWTAITVFSVFMAIKHRVPSGAPTDIEMSEIFASFSEAWVTLGLILGPPAALATLYWGLVRARR